MPSHVALLYSIVLSPTRRVVMADLRAMTEAAGFGAVETLVSTGNLVFDGGGLPTGDIETRLETAFEATFGRSVDIIVREADAWRALVAANSFPDESAADSSRVMVRVMRRGAPAEAVERLRTLLGVGERLEWVQGDLWAVFPRQPSQSRLLSAISPRKLGIGTARNWNTVRRLGELLDAKPPR